VNTDTTELVKFNMWLIAGRPEYRPHYFRLEPNGKEPVKGIPWKDQQHRLTFEQAEGWMRKSGNVGIAACGRPWKIDHVTGKRIEDETQAFIDGLVIQDQDLGTLTGFKGPTLKSRTRKRTGFHHFYWTADPRCKVNIPTEKLGENRADWYYVVCPGSYVPTTIDSLQAAGDPVPPSEQLPFLGRYTVEVAQPLATITFEEFPAHFREQVAKAEATPARKKVEHRTDDGGSDSGLWKLRIEGIVGCDHGSWERFPSIFHDSATGKNASVTPSSSEGPGLVHCWRHGVSLTPLQALAVLAGLGDCVDIGEAHKNSMAGSSTLKYTKGTIMVLWEFAKAKGFLPLDDPDPLQSLADAEYHKMLQRLGLEPREGP
jgi:hypothetical protein